MEDTSTRTGYESDYQQRVSTDHCGEFIAGTLIEVMNEPSGRGGYKHVLFDFDGTLSLIREGWPEVMIPMMVEYLLETPEHESACELEQMVRDFVSELTGKQTIYQMIQLANEVSQRGGTPLDPADYKQEYLDRLMVRIASRREALRSGQAKSEEMVVPHAFDLLDRLAGKGVALYLASGTDEQFVLEEAELLALTPYFRGHIYGALADYKSFSKAMVIERILKENQVEGKNLLGFGDGFVEIDNVKSAGGTGIGVASDETAKSGKPDPWKRSRLVGVGADIIIPDYRDCDALLNYLFP